ncbi:MAG: co-chaperone DjlA [Legionellaceae bacterium]|nr:co-chaperone DjlA [Legionellaceae bacterium]
MEFRQYFAKKTWWGKLIGAFFGFLIAGPIGALFGLLIGNFFDHGLMEHFSKPFWYFHTENDPEVRQIFFESTFILLGYIAKSEGRVSETSINCAKDVMLKMALDPKQIKTAQDYFNQGKANNFNPKTILKTLYQTIEEKPTLIRLFIETQYQFARQTGLTEKKILIINQLLTALCMAPLHQQQHFSDESTGYSNAYTRYQQHTSSNQQQYKPQYSHFALNEAYTILKLTPSASHAEVKRAYRRQTSLYHPDKLIAKGASEAAIKQATEKTQQIRKAYEQICAAKGWQ